MQRVAIARSLINSPPVLLADEPTGNLDSRNAETIMNLFETLNGDGVTIVVVTHNVDLAKRCHREVHIEDGRIDQ
jgi:putative ABC transport system ATP-binding protein